MSDDTYPQYALPRHSVTSPGPDQIQSERRTNNDLNTPFLTDTGKQLEAARNRIADLEEAITAVLAAAWPSHEHGGGSVEFYAVPVSIITKLRAALAAGRK